MDRRPPLHRLRAFATLSELAVFTAWAKSREPRRQFHPLRQATLPTLYLYDVRQPVWIDWWRADPLRANIAPPCKSCRLVHQARDPAIFPVQERLEPGGIVRHDRTDDRSAFRQCGPPRRHLRHGFEQTKVDKALEGAEVAERRRKHDIDETESCSRKIGTGHDCPLELLELVHETIAPCREGCQVRRGFQHPDVGEDGGAEFHPGAMFGALDRIARVQGIWGHILDVFNDGGGFEQD